MKKKMIYNSIALSILLLGSIHTGYRAYADELPQETPETDVVVVSPIDLPVTTTLPADPETPEPIQPIEDTTAPQPALPGEASPEIVVVTPVDTPISPVPEDTKPAQPTLPVVKEELKDKEIEEVNKDSQLVPSPAPAEELQLAPQPVTLPSLESPLVTQTGHQVVSTENSQVLILTNQGEVETVTLETIGAIKQSDGTVAVKDNMGKLHVLPATGDGDQVWLSIVGFLTVLVGVFLKVTHLRRLPR